MPILKSDQHVAQIIAESVRAFVTSPQRFCDSSVVRTRAALTGHEHDHQCWPTKERHEAESVSTSSCYPQRKPNPCKSMLRANKTSQFRTWLERNNIGGYVQCPFTIPIRFLCAFRGRIPTVDLTCSRPPFEGLRL